MYRQKMLGTLDPDDFFFSPDELDNEANSVNGFMLSLNSDIANRILSFDGATIDAWNSLLKEWTSFYDSLQGITGWFKRHERSTRNKLIEYGNRYEEWRKKYETTTLTSSSAGAMPDKPSPEYKNPPLVSEIKSIVIIGGTIVVGGLVIKVLSDAGLFKKLFGGK